MFPLLGFGSTYSASSSYPSQSRLAWSPLEWPPPTIFLLSSHATLMEAIIHSPLLLLSPTPTDLPPPQARFPLGFTSPPPPKTCRLSLKLAYFLFCERPRFDPHTSHFCDMSFTLLSRYPHRSILSGPLYLFDLLVARISMMLSFKVVNPRGRLTIKYGEISTLPIYPRLYLCGPMLLLSICGGSLSF